MKNLFLFLLIFSSNAYSQNLFNCRTDSVFDSSNKIEYKEINDSIYTIKVTVNNIKIEKEYPFIDDVEMCKFVPKFVLKFKNSFIFITGVHQHYRLLTVFQLVDNRIIISELKNELLLNSSEDGFDKMLFFYRDQPIALFLGVNETFTKIYKRDCARNSHNIDNVVVSEKEFVVNYKNKKTDKFDIKAFR